jgi:hypothetical protein
MLKFSIIEVINKLIGLVITAVIARILDEKLGTFIYYQTVYSYLYSISVFSSDYKFLINYKKNKDYIGSTDFYHTMVLRVLIVLIIITIAPFLLSDLDQFAFWPFYLCIVISLIVSEFILFVNNEKKGLILFRFISQFLALVLAIMFYKGIINQYYIALIILIQNGVLLIFTFSLAQKHIQSNLSFDQLISSVPTFSYKKVFNLMGYYSIRHFFLFITTIELYILSFYGKEGIRDLFAEGIRLSIILVPFAYFYINFNINKLNSKFYLAITVISLIFVLGSPVTTLVLYGENFIDSIYYFNFFILVFYFNSFVEKESIDLLTTNDRNKGKLIKLNITYFLATTVVILVVIRKLDVNLILIIYLIKLLIYTLFFKVCLSLKNGYLLLVLPFVLVVFLNTILLYLDYFNWSTSLFLELKNNLNSYL